MEREDYTTRIVVNGSLETVFKAIVNVRAWWTENIEGNTYNLHDEFKIDFGETFVTIIIEELIPYKRICWLVKDCNLHWLQNKKEWRDTRIVFDIADEDSLTVIRFTHIGLNPEATCYNDCVKGWDEYINGSLFNLLNRGLGSPQKKMNVPE